MKEKFDNAQNEEYDNEGGCACCLAILIMFLFFGTFITFGFMSAYGG